MKYKKIASCFLILFSLLLPATIYAAKNETTQRFIVEMDCPSCAKKIEKNIAFEKGVTDLIINIKKQTVDISYKTNKTDVSKLQAAFKKIGLTAQPVSESVK